MGVAPKHCGVHPCMGDKEHQGFKLNKQRAQAMEMTHMHPGISSCLYYLLR